MKSNGVNLQNINFSSVSIRLAIGLFPFPSFASFLETKKFFSNETSLCVLLNVFLFS